MLLKITMKKPANEINGRATYQGYTFMDEHGTRRRANVFGRQIDLFDKVLTEGEVCQLSLPIVKKADAQYAMYPGEQQLTLCGSTRIRILPTPERPIDFKPRYLPLSEIKNMLFKQTYDIVVVVVRVDPPHQVKSQATGLPLDLAYLYITDDRSKTQNLNLTSRKLFIPDIQTIETEIQTTTLKSALQKNGEEGQKCTSCDDPGQCTAKLVLDFTASDDETTYEFAAMTKTAEKILSIKVIEYHNMNKEERINFNANALTTLLTKKVSLIIKPSPSHLDHNKLEWELKYMEGH